MRAPASSVEVGPGVKSLKKGDHVIPLYTPECRECEYCLSRKTNLCQKIRTTQGQGLMPDGTSRFSYQGQKVLALYGLLHLRQPHGAAGDRAGEDPRGRALRQGLLHRLRRHHRRRRGDQHRQGRGRRQLRGVRPRRHRPQRDPGLPARRRQHDRRRGPEPGSQGLGREVRHDRIS